MGYVTIAIIGVCCSSDRDSSTVCTGYKHCIACCSCINSTQILSTGIYVQVSPEIQIGSQKNFFFLFYDDYLITKHCQEVALINWILKLMNYEDGSLNLT